MKNLNVPATLAIIFLLVIGSVYIYKNIKTEAPVIVDTTTKQSSLTFPKIDFDLLVRFMSIPKATLDEEARNAMQHGPCSIQDIKLLLSKVKKAGPTIAEFDANKTIDGFRGFIAFGKLVEGCSHDSESLTYFINILNLKTSSEIEIVVAGSALANFGQPEATKALIDWSRSYKNDASELIYKWLVEARDGTSIDMLLNTIKQQLSFVNNKNKDAFIKAVKYWCGHRSDSVECEQSGFPFYGIN